MKQVRVVKFDDLNFGIEILKTYPELSKDGTPHPNAGESYWAETTYYGARLSWTLEAACLMGMDVGEAQKVALAFAEAIKQIKVVDKNDGKEAID